MYENKRKMMTMMMKNGVYSRTVRLNPPPPLKNDEVRRRNPDLFSGCVNTTAVAYYFVTINTETPQTHAKLSRTMGYKKLKKKRKSKIYRIIAMVCER